MSRSDIPSVWKLVTSQFASAGHTATWVRRKNGGGSSNSAGSKTHRSSGSPPSSRLRKWYRAIIFGVGRFWRLLFFFAIGASPRVGGILPWPRGEGKSPRPGEKTAAARHHYRGRSPARITHAARPDGHGTAVPPACAGAAPLRPSVGRRRGPRERGGCAASGAG